MKRLLFLLISTAIVGVVGCGDVKSFDIAPVSGTVTMDEKPLAGATVTFLPSASDGLDAGPASVGETDASGKFTLKTADGEEGAVVAIHKVMITTFEDNATSSEDDNVYAEAEREKVPPRYNSDTDLTFEVPAAGSTEADFAISSRFDG